MYDVNAVKGITDLVEVDRETFYEFLMTAPGLHNWKAPQGLGFSDSQGKLHGFLANRTDGLKFFMSFEELRRG